ncbi:MAG: aminotransferase class IV [Flavobacteriales bacterium]|nr:aminotransferase class IV [Flavobacteriales bacterium]
MQNRSFLYGDGFFESIRIIDKSIPLLNLHLERAQKTALFFGMNWPKKWDEPFFKHEIFDKYELTNGVVRITFYRANGGLYYTENAEICFEVSSRLMNETGIFLLNENTTSDNLIRQISELNELKLVVGTYIKKPINPLSPFKLNSAILYVYAAQQLKTANGIDDLFLLNEDGNICEALSSNVLIYIDGNWITPNMQTQGPVNGVYFAYMRQYISVKEKTVTINELKSAELILLTNATLGIRRACLIG